MLRKTLFGMTILLSLQTYQINAQYVIKGELVGSNGKPMKQAGIQLLTNIFPYDLIIKTFPVNNDGSFRINFSNPGFYRLRFCGLYHKPLGQKEFSLYLDQKDSVELKVTLQKYPLKDSLKKVIFYTKPVNSFFTKRLEAEIQSDSTSFIEIKADSNFVPYSVGGFSTMFISPTSAGEGSDLYNLDRGGDYYSIVETKIGSMVKLVFDLKKHAGFKEKEKIDYIRLPEHTKKFMIASDDFNKRLGKYFEASRSASKDRSSNADVSFHENYNWESELDKLEILIRNERDDFLRKAYQISRIALTLGAEWYKPKDLVSEELAKMALTEIDPDSPIWSFYPMGMLKSIGVLTRPIKEISEIQLLKVESKEVFQPFMDYFIRAVESHPDSSIRELLLVGAIQFAKRNGFDETLNKYVMRYETEFKSSVYYKQRMQEFTNTQILKIGDPVPDFEFTAVNSNNIKVSRTSMLGKKYIIHFWAAWCGPCSGSIEALRNIVNQFGRGKLHILSVSLCYNKGDIIEYQKKHPMPWFNCHVDMKNDANNVLKKFDVVSIPKEILVDERGYIIAIDDLEKIMEIISKK